MILMLNFFSYIWIVYNRKTIYIDSYIHYSIPDFLSEKYFFKVGEKIYFVGCLSIFYFVDFEQVSLQILFHKLKSNIRASVQTTKQK